MYFGVDYHPEQWVYPYGGTREKPEAAWERDIELMQTAGINVVRMGEFTWGLCEPEEGKFEFGWLKRVMNLLGKAGIKVVLATPTAAPPIWLARKHPEILPVDERGLVKHEGTRRAVCLNSDVFWDYSKRIVENMAKALGQHPQLIAWQIDNSLGRQFHRGLFQRRRAPGLASLAGGQVRNYRAVERVDGFAPLGPNRHGLEPSADADGRTDGSQPGAGAGLVPVLQRHHCAVRQDAG